MKKIFLTLLLLTISSFSIAIDGIHQPSQNPLAAFRLFNTPNIYTLLKLDTRSGQIWQLQWGESGDRYIIPVDERPLVANGSPGRFTLQPTHNMYTFILIDQVTGDTWHVQWSKNDARFRLPITQYASPN